MSACDQLVANASAGAAPALRAVDCMANEAAATMFGRLFGTGGAMLPALTILLTLYIAFFAISLLTGRSRIGISALTPRMMTLGLVLTFATSWTAYQGVVWTLATGAPDQIAGVLLGAGGSATQMFADRIDMVFAAISEASGGGQQAADPGAQAASGAASGSFTPGNLMWLSALLLLLGTVGVLVTARIALAVLLAVGPVFVVLALFPGTRGLFAGWLRGVVLTAVTPLFTVLGGSFMIELAVPVVAALRGAEGIDGRASMALFTIAAVHVALMAMVMKVASTVAGSWQVFGIAPARGGDGDSASAAPPHGATYGQSEPAALVRHATRGAPQVNTPASAADAGAAPPQAPVHARTSRTVITQMATSPAALPPLPARRASGIGSRFALRPNRPREMQR